MARGPGRPRKNPEPQTNGPAPAPATQPAGHNSLEPAKVKSYVGRIENIHDELEKERGTYMAACKALREDIKDIFDEAKDAGIPRRALKSVIKVRALEYKAEKARDDLEQDDQQAHDRIRLALGDLADLPLGQAALGQQPFASA